MEILNILYSNNLIAVYLIGAILVVILIFIVISSMSTTPKNDNNILEDPTEEDANQNILNSENIKEEKMEEPNISKINDMVEELYQKSLNEDVEEKKETSNLNSFLEEFDVPDTVIEEVTSNEVEFNDEPLLTEITETKEIEEIEKPRLKETEEKSENIEDMLRRLYELRQSENETRKTVLLNEIYDLKKQVDETLKSNYNNYSFDYNYLDTKVLADYYLFNEDIEFPKLK